jgi:hypothetical protein
LNPKPSNNVIGRFTEIGELCRTFKAATHRSLIFLAVVLALEASHLVLSNRSGAMAFVLIGLGSFLALSVWCSSAIGLPLLPVLAVQSLIIYGLPIVVGHGVILTYPREMVFQAGQEVLIFQVAMALSWKFGMQLFHPSPPVSYALSDLMRSGDKGWGRLGFGMIAGTTAFQVLQSFNLLDSVTALLPNGSVSILYTLVSVVSASAFFLTSMSIADGSTSFTAKAFFWLLLILSALITASGLLLYAAAANLITVAIGFFWSSGRIPWRYLVISMLALSFLNMGKTTMRERYWGAEGESITVPTLGQLPAFYAEWSETCLDAILENRTSKKTGGNAQETKANSNQTLLDRIDNLQNLLFVIDAIETQHISALHGATYALIPPLLVPRVLVPNKPRSHEGQVLLNVHFGRQDINSTFSTYVAWGLLPEAYGNFGAYWGSLFLGALLGLSFAWIENLTARRLLFSTEGFLSLSLLMNFMNSFEMVSSVFVTSTFQSFMVIIGASLPFVRRVALKRSHGNGD